MTLQEVEKNTDTDEMIHLLKCFIEEKDLMQELETWLDEVEIETLDQKFEEAREYYNLPNYDREAYRQFVVDCFKQELEVIHYNGRFFFQGPGALVDSANEVITKVKWQSDTMGKGFVVYPV